MMEHIIETMDDWLKGNAVITIEFETEKNEIHQQNNLFIHQHSGIASDHSGVHNIFNILHDQRNHEKENN